MGRTFWLVLAALSACVSAAAPVSGILLNRDTVRLEGWFSAKGEWTLFPTSDLQHYDPYVKEENKCVSLINATESGRAEYLRLQGKKVVVVGFAVKYDDLPTGNSPADRLLSKKYFGNDVVENYCLRDFVFVARAIRAEQ